MVTKKNLMEIVQKLIANVTESQMGNKYRDELISKLIDICSQNDYQFVANFEWFAFKMF
jgi:AP-3 complex subunit delta-1